jgi:hyperosmotically inducible periplasmic protein
MIMKRAYGLAVVLAMVMGAVCAVGVGRAQQEGVGEKAGEKLDEVGRKIKRGLNKAEDAVREGFHKTRESVHSMGVAARVYGRLHWDKALHSSTINVKVEEGVATLNGSVPTTEARTKAVNLAADTVGVNKVVDELTVPASAAEEAPAPKR